MLSAAGAACSSAAAAVRATMGARRRPAAWRCLPHAYGPAADTGGYPPSRRTSSSMVTAAGLRLRPVARSCCDLGPLGAGTPGLRRCKGWLSRLNWSQSDRGQCKPVRHRQRGGRVAQTAPPRSAAPRPHPSAVRCSKQVSCITRWSRKRRERFAGKGDLVERWSTAARASQTCSNVQRRASGRRPFSRPKDLHVREGQAFEAALQLHTDHLEVCRRFAAPPDRQKAAPRSCGRHHGMEPARAAALPAGQHHALPGEARRVRGRGQVPAALARAARCFRACCACCARCALLDCVADPQSRPARPAAPHTHAPPPPPQEEDARPRRQVCQYREGVAVLLDAVRCSS